MAEVPTAVAPHFTAGQQQAIAQIKSVLSNRSRNIVELSKLKGKMSVLLGQE